MLGPSNAKKKKPNRESFPIAGLKSLRSASRCIHTEACVTLHALPQFIAAIVAVIPKPKAVFCTLKLCTKLETTNTRYVSSSKIHRRFQSWYFDISASLVNKSWKMLLYQQDQLIKMPGRSINSVDMYLDGLYHLISY
jgi:hypothetical protein